MSNENYLPQETLTQILEKLSEACKENNNEIIHELLKEAVEGF